MVAKKGGRKEKGYPPLFEALGYPLQCQLYACGLRAAPNVKKKMGSQREGRKGKGLWRVLRGLAILSHHALAMA